MFLNFTSSQFEISTETLTVTVTLTLVFCVAVLVCAQGLSREAASNKWDLDFQRLRKEQRDANNLNGEVAGKAGPGKFSMGLAWRPGFMFMFPVSLVILISGYSITIVGLQPLAVVLSFFEMTMMAMERLLK